MRRLFTISLLLLAGSLAFAQLVGIPPVTISGLTAGNTFGTFSDYVFEVEPGSTIAGRSNVVYTDDSAIFLDPGTIPAVYQNCNSIQTKHADRGTTGASLITFTPTVRITATVWHDRDITSKAAWLGDVTSEVITSNSGTNVYDGYAQACEADALCTLGGNTTDANTSESMYFVSICNASLLTFQPPLADAGQYIYTSATGNMLESDTSTRCGVTRQNGFEGAVSVDISDALTGTCVSATDYTAITDTTKNWADGIDGHISGVAITSADITGDCTIILDFVTPVGGIVAGPTNQTCTVTVQDAAVSAVYVATTGSNANPGTEASPWLTVDFAVDNAAPGDTIFLRTGTYNELVTIGVSGTVGLGITLTNYAGETATIDGTGIIPPGDTALIYGLDISYYTITDNTTGALQIQNITGRAIMFEGSGSNLEVSGVDIQDGFWQSGVGADCITFRATRPGQFGNAAWVQESITDIVIDGNTITDYKNGNDNTGGQCINVAFNTDRSKITNNVLDNVWNIGIDYIGQQNKFGGGIANPDSGYVAGNTVKNSGKRPNGVQTAYYCDGCKNVVYENNICQDSHEYCWTISTEDSAFTSDQIIVRHNRIIRPGAQGSTALATGIFGMAITGSSSAIRHAHNSVFVNGSGNSRFCWQMRKGTDVEWKNNICSTQVAPARGIGQDVACSSTPILDFNLYFPATAQMQYQCNFFTTVANYIATSGQDANSINSDPLFTNPAANDLTLQGGSPAINAGTCLTQTNGTGSTSVTLIVDDARWFHDGMGINGLAGDNIEIGSNPSTAISSINYGTDTITLSSAISWGDGECVSYIYNGASPDIGWDET